MWSSQPGETTLELHRLSTILPQYRLLLEIPGNRLNADAWIPLNLVKYRRSVPVAPPSVWPIQPSSSQGRRCRFQQLQFPAAMKPSKFAQELAHLVPAKVS